MTELHSRPYRNSRGHLIDVLNSYRWPLSDEKVLQAEIARAFQAQDITFRREVYLGPGDIVDFMVGDVAVEVKIKGAKRAIYRQLERYAAHDAVGAILLATNVPMGLPEHINGKPVSIAALGRGWL